MFMCVVSCSERTNNRNHFYTMAKLFYKDQAMASAFLDTINISSFSKDEQPYCELLKIQATDLTDNNIKPYEKMTEDIIKYMKHNNDCAFLKIAYYYAGRIKHEKRKALEAFNDFNLAISNENLYGLNSRSYAQMADIYYKQYLYAYAKDMYSKAYYEARKENDTIGMAKILKDKALVYLDEKKRDSSLILLKKALKIAKTSKDNCCISSVKSYYAMTYADMKNWKSAEKMLPSFIGNINQADSSAYYYIAANIYRHTNKNKATYFYNFLKTKATFMQKKMPIHSSPKKPSQIRNIIKQWSISKNIKRPLILLEQAQILKCLQKLKVFMIIKDKKQKLHKFQKRKMSSSIGASSLSSSLFYQQPQYHFLSFA